MHTPETIESESEGESPRGRSSSKRRLSSAKEAENPKRAKVHYWTRTELKQRASVPKVILEMVKAICHRRVFLQFLKEELTILDSGHQHAPRSRCTRVQSFFIRLPKCSAPNANANAFLDEARLRGWNSARQDSAMVPFSRRALSGCKLISYQPSGMIIPLTARWYLGNQFNARRFESNLNLGMAGTIFTTR